MVGEVCYITIVLDRSLANRTHGPLAAIQNDTRVIDPTQKLKYCHILLWALGLLTNLISISTSDTTQIMSYQVLYCVASGSLLHSGVDYNGIIMQLQNHTYYDNVKLHDMIYCAVYITIHY